MTDGRLGPGLPDVTGLSLRARLAVALHLFRVYCARRRLAHPEIDRFVEHLWEFIGLYGDPEAFGRWVEREPPLTHAGLGDPLPAGVDAALADVGASPVEFRKALECTTEVIYTSMYGAASESWSRRFLLELAEIVLPLGVTWPDALPFAGSRWADDSGWGDRPSAVELAEWRRLGPA